MRTFSIIIDILSGKSFGISMVSMDVSAKDEQNPLLKDILKQDFISAEVDKVECLTRQDDIIRFYCNVKDMEKTKIVLNYIVSNEDHRIVSNFYSKCKNPRYAKDNTKAIMLIKNIIESYDPMIQLKIQE